jgi:hypothetical protein
MATVSLSEGARMVGRSKGTLSKALASGKMSFVERTDNGYAIDTSELFRAFPPKQPLPVVEARSETPVETPETIRLRVEVEMLRQRVGDLATDRDAWREQAQRLLLEGPQHVAMETAQTAQEVSPTETVETAQPRNGWRFWKRD